MPISHSQKKTSQASASARTISLSDRPLPTRLSMDR